MNNRESKTLDPRLTNLEIKEMCIMMQKNYEIIKGCIETYFEVNEKYMNKIMEHLEKI